MGKCRNATKGDTDAQKVISSTPLSHMGETGNTNDVLCDLRGEVASFVDALSQMGASSKIPFHFIWCSRSPSEWLLSPEHQQSNPALEDQTWYCTQVRVTLGEGEGYQPSPFHPWTSSLIANITEALVLSPWGGDLILQTTIAQGGAPSW